ncbi:MAG: DUF1598 domain-containing protein [Planctomycetaceae bacterium]|nr:DUF1598 domain-containing protein [Planctomycetaceae bacterium]
MVDLDQNLRRFALNGLSAACGLFAMAGFGVAAETNVDEHLAAGEFGRALTAIGTANESDRADLLANVAQAQSLSGDRLGARATLLRAPAGESRDQALYSQQGGGAVADFQYLMTIIQDNTSGQWELVDGVGGTMSQDPYGVKVRPLDVLSRISFVDESGRLAKATEVVRKADLNADLARPTPMRIVSLTRLEQEVAARLSAGQPVPESMQRLAGLTRAQYVFVVPESREVLIAGPAEGWAYNKLGDPIGAETGAPVLQLDDLVTVLRTFANGEADFGCSINTRDQGLKALKDYAEASQARGPLAPGAVRNWVKTLSAQLGPQDVVVWGVPADSRVARVIVEADYRMKLIGIDKISAGREVASYFDLLTAEQRRNPVPMEALRWWLTMKYDAVLHNPDKTAFELVGQSVQCRSENQMLTDEGKHLPTGVSEGTNRLFAEGFTRKYAQIAAAEPVFADARNLFDLALVSALLQKEGLLARTHWELGVFAPEGAYRPARHGVPAEVDSVANHRTYGGRDIVVQVAGGVRADISGALEDAKPQVSDDTGSQLTTAALPEGRWWWDAGTR